MKDCGDKVLNLKSKICIKPDGNTSKKLLMEQINGIYTYFEDNDVEKILKEHKKYFKEYIELKKNKEKNKITDQNDIKIEQNVSDNIKIKLKKFLLKNKLKAFDKKYLNDNHKDYCLKNKLLDDNIIYITYKIALQYYNCTHFRVFSFDMTNLFETSNLSKIKYTIKNDYYSIQINNYNKYLYDNLLPFMNESTIKDMSNSIINKKWFNKLNEYIVNLNYTDLFALKGYTYHGDQIINKYLIGTFNYSNFYTNLMTYKYNQIMFPFFFDILLFYKVKAQSKKIEMKKDFKNINFNKKFLDLTLKERKELYKTIIDNLNKIDENEWYLIFNLYIKRLENIIKNAPPLTHKMVVYRGVKNDYFSNNMKNVFYKNKNFVSTSININTSQRFSGYDCCLQKITLLPGTRIIYMGGITSISNEFEFLLSRNTNYLFRSFTDQYKTHTNEDICRPYKEKIKVSDIVVL